MKKLFTALLLPLISFQAISQDEDSIITLPEVVITAEWMVNEKIDKSFAARFPEAYDIVWRRLNKDYLTKFIEVDLKHQALFRKNGSLIYDIIYVDKNHLPKKIGDLVQRAYTDYDITNGARIERAGQEFWIVNLENTRSYIVLRLDDEEISEVKRIQKSLK